MKALFFHPEQRRLRTVWRLALSGMALGVAATLLRLAVSWSVAVFDGSVESAAFRAMYALAHAALTCFVVAACVRAFDRRPIRELGLRPHRMAALDLAFGLLLGGGLMAAVAAAEIAFGWARYTALASPLGRSVDVSAAIAVFIGVSVSEELIFRGYLLRNLADGFGGWGSPGSRGRTARFFAVVVSAGLFGIAHAQNPHASPVSTLNIFGAGLMLASAYLATGHLALPVGLHLGWNAAQNLLGIPVSGSERFRYGALLEREPVAPPWLTGGAFGAEGGLTGFCAIVLGLLALAVYRVVRRGVASRASH